MLRVFCVSGSRPYLCPPQDLSSLFSFPPPQVDPHPRCRSLLKPLRGRPSLSRYGLGPELLSEACPWTWALHAGYCSVQRVVSRPGGWAGGGWWSPRMSKQARVARREKGSASAWLELVACSCLAPGHSPPPSNLALLPHRLSPRIR